MRLIARTSACALLLAALSAAQLRVPFWAYGPDGTPRSHLTAKGVQAWINEQEAPVGDLKRPGDPLVLLLVMDAVGDLNRIDAARQALTEHIKNMGKEWNIALLQAQDGLRVIQDPTGNRRLLIEKLNGLGVSGYPGLLDSVSETGAIAHQMMQKSKVRVAALFVTDGAIREYRGDYTATVVNPSDSRDLSRRFGDRVIQEKIATLSRNLQDFIAPMFFVHLQERTDSSDVAYQNGIGEFARATGGEAYFVRGVAEVAPLIHRALDMIGQEYVATLDAPKGVSGTAALRLEAKDSVRLAYRQNLEIVQSKKRKKR